VTVQVEATQQREPKTMAIPTRGDSLARTAEPSERYPAALAMVTVLFFFWGFVTVLNDILVPHLKSVFDLNYTEVMLVQFAFFAAYFVFSIPSAKVIDAIGYQRTMVAGLLTMGVGAFLFVPAASALSYPLFLAALLVLAGGITALQVAANPYVAVLGPPETASSRLNLTQAFNSLGTTVGPWVGGWLILGAAEGKENPGRLSADALRAMRVHQAASVKAPYLMIAVALVGFAILIGRFRLPKIPNVERPAEPRRGESLWRYRHLVLGSIAIFTYVGAEVAIGSFLINYLNQPGIANLPEVQGARFVSYYWGGAMVGRFLGSAILQRVRTVTVLGFAALLATTLVLTSMLTTGKVATGSILLVGFFNSIMFPSIFTLGIAKLGPRTGDGSGLLIMSIVGGAILPVAQGAIADRIGVHHAFLLPVLCYLYIAFYGLRGSRPVGVE